MGFHEEVFPSMRTVVESHLPADGTRITKEIEDDVMNEVLEKLLEPLYYSDGIGLVSSDDEVIPPHKLDALEAAVRSAVVQVERQPERWPVHIGNEFIRFQEEFGDPIYRVAERERLLTFLAGVLSEIDLARRHGHYLIWGGGT